MQPGNYIKHLLKIICKNDEMDAIALLASFVNFLLPNREFGEGWGGVKNLRLLQGLL